MCCLAFALSCGSGVAISNDTPTEAYKRLYSAVKSKNTEVIKKELTKKTIEFAGFASHQNNQPIEKVFENGFTSTTFSETLPAIRDERVVDNMGAVEVWNTKESKWEDVPFMKEDGKWKLAIGELFQGLYKPDVVGRGRAFKEAEAANALRGNQMMPAPGINVNANFVVNTNSQIPAAKPSNSAK